MATTSANVFALIVKPLADLLAVSCRAEHVIEMLVVEGRVDEFQRGKFVIVAHEADRIECRRPQMTQLRGCDRAAGRTDGGPAAHR